MRYRAAQAGFTIIELIVVIVIAGILATMIASFIGGPIQGAVQQDARAALVDQADIAMQRMSRAIHDAVPNSARVPAGSGQRLEIIGILEGASYRVRPGSGPGASHNTPDDRLNTNTADAAFNILGRFGQSALAPGNTLTNNQRIVIYPTDPGELYQDAAANNPGQELVITPASDGTNFRISLADDTDETKVRFDTAFDFAYGSPVQRLYVTDTPRSFVCDLAAGELLMYWGYAIQTSQPDQSALDSLVSGGNAERTVLARNVTGCAFDYEPGTPERAGLVTASLTLSTSRAGVVELLQQIHVVNTP
ncbi:prepilin-type N-terminal cleavage/methylation domain-containing protein [Ectothiorhodospiraceae bacterium WFHF3C12]|nr:prepilin-type N-terminal cleavage/methylation domain-containing protein [Ectothiorhodospiraceae bacterium WFHF3C12]